jgi:CheY-like chemotaxis protein
MVRILVVDDALSCRELISEALRYEPLGGHDVTAAEAVRRRSRRWMRDVEWQIDQCASAQDCFDYDDTDGPGGDCSVVIPDFHFETSLEQISKLKDVSEKLFDLIHTKNTANFHLKWCIEYHDDDEIFDLFRGQSAKLYFDAAALYTRRF